MKNLLEVIQNNLLQRAKDFRLEHTSTANNMDELKDRLDKQGGFVRVMWNGDTALETVLKEDLKATIRCMPDHEELDAKLTPCVFSGEIKESNKEILIARAY